MKDALGEHIHSFFLTKKRAGVEEIRFMRLAMGSRPMSFQLIKASQRHMGPVRPKLSRLTICDPYELLKCTL